MKKYIIDIALAAGILLAVLIGSFREFSASAEQVQSEVLRLHIPANSDSEEDQRIKLELRDYLLEHYGSLLSDSGTLSEAEQRCEELLPEIENACNAFLSENGMDYAAKAELVTMYFTTRVYDTVTLPAGTYRALRVTLGAGEGQNWWCIMFPPLCLPAVSEPAEESVDDEEDILADFEQPHIYVKFALYEFIRGLIRGEY